MTPAGHTILGILADRREKFAREITKASGEFLRRPEVFRDLEALEVGGYIDGRLEPAPALMLPRKLYRIAPKGMDYLEGA